MYIKNNNLENELITKVINQLFLNLNSNDKDILSKYYFILIDVIAHAFNIYKKEDKFIDQLRLNNYRDAKAILLLILPFINDKVNTNNINNFSEIFTKKNNFDKYNYSNTQYGIIDRKTSKEKIYSEEILKQNLTLLIQTILYVKNRLFTNWSQIIQNIDINKINKKINFDLFNLRDLEVSNDKFYEKLETMKDLQIDYIYENITNDLYFNIKNYKWLIYDISNDEDDEEEVDILSRYKINTYFFMKNKFNYLFNYNDENDIKNEDRFLIDFFKILEEANDNKDIYFEDKNKKYLIPNKKIQKIFINFVIFYEKYHVKKENSEKDEIIIRDEKKIFSYAYNYIKKIKDKEEIYNYYMESHRAYEHLENIILEIIDQDNTKIYTVKNLYNYAKSLCHQEEVEKYIQFPRFWRSLDENQKNIIKNRLLIINDIENKTDKDIIKTNNWFNIKGILKKMYPTYNSSKIEDLNNNIFSEINKNIIDTIIKIQNHKGCFTKIKFSLLENPTKDMPVYFKNNFNSNEYKNNTYNFLTNELYINTNIRDKKGHISNYYDWFGTENCFFYDLYAFDWIAQINFFHKYLNNRVIFLTGGTGVGKSTAAPSMFLYALKAVDYKINGKIICSQPRKAPTRDNSQAISTLLGVQIIKDEKTSEYQYNSINKNIQFRYKGKNLSSKGYKGNVLEMVVDKILSLELRDALCKIKIKDNFTTGNLYDIIMVDESHEHNTNMDLILTQAKHIVNYNNEIKLVIISATMDDDEAIYRRYYRDINDNRMYPLNVDLQKNKLDRINVDRRLHISKPGEVNIYKIQEYWLDYEYKSYEPEDRVLKILSETTSGDILLFQPGKAEIKKSMKYLLEKTPSNILILPYFSELDREIQEIIPKIGDYINKIRMDRNIDFDTIKREDLDLGSSSYTRAIIIGTNIIEASSTISSLRYVVETGTQKINKFDFTKKNNSIIKTPISDTSRIQRRGRVGRVAPGTVYYMYPKGTTEKNKTQYKICIEDITDEIYFKLSNSNIEEIIFNKNNDPNNPNNKNNINLSNLKKIYKNGIDKIIERQYFINNKFYDYFGNFNFYDYENYEPLIEVYETGFSINTIRDINGKFFIIHYDENILNRDILGKIISLDIKEPKLKNQYNLIDNNIISNKINSFIKNLEDKIYIITDKQNINYQKTNIGKHFIKLQEILEIEDKNIITFIIYTRIFNCENLGLKFATILNSIGNNLIGDLIKYNLIDNKKIYEIDSAKNLINSSDITSDIFYLVKILDIFIKLLENKLYFDFYIIKDKLFADISLEEFNNKIIKDEYILRKIKYKIYEYEDEIKNICDRYKIQYTFIIKILIKYMEILLIKYKLDNNLFEDKVLKEYNFNNFFIVLKNIYFNKDLYKDTDKITVCLLLTYPYNIAKKYSGSPFYINLYSPTLDNVYTINTIGKKFKDTMINPVYSSNYILYLKSNIEENKINFIHYVDLKLIKYISYIYKNLNYDEYNNVSLIGVKKLEPIILADYRNVINTIKSDINNLDYNNIKQIIKEKDKEINIQKGGNIKYMDINKQLLKYYYKNNNTIL
jgi:hypothetical protein